MEKEGAEKPITEWDNSVTSEEYNSLAEKEKEMDKSNEILEKGLFAKKDISTTEKVEESPPGTSNSVGDEDSISVDAENSITSSIVPPAKDELANSNGQELVATETEIAEQSNEPTTDSEEGEDKTEPNIEAEDDTAKEPIEAEVVEKSEPPADLDIVEHASTKIISEETEVADSKVSTDEAKPEESKMESKDPEQTEDDSPTQKVIDSKVEEVEATEATTIKEDEEGDDETETSIEVEGDAAKEPVEAEVVEKSEPPADLDIIDSDTTEIIKDGNALANTKKVADEVVPEEPKKDFKDPEQAEDESPTKAVDTKVEEVEATETTEATTIKDDEENWDGTDFTALNKEELVDAVKKLGKHDNPFFADKILQLIAPLFNTFRSTDRKEALDLFLAEGGIEEAFQYTPDDLSLRFDANYKLIKSKKSKRFKEQDKERAANFILAEESLKKLRSFVDSEESSASFNGFKELQKEWKAIGDVPSQKSRTLWANYNALVDRFYDQRGIYFELKELDRKKNYEAKQILCEKAETLGDIKNVREAIKNLNDLHSEYKHLGPVPQKLQEDLWQRFKSASDKIYEKRKVFVNELKAELNENLSKKEELVEKIKVYIDYNTDRIKEWNEKTKEVLSLQKDWESAGGLPKDKAKKVNKDFWSSFKKFFGNKHKFFKQLDADREVNLTKKQELIVQVEKLKDSQDWLKTAEEFKKLQNDWREIGQVPEKLRNKLYEEFKEHCDFFFEEKRSGLKQSQGQFKENLINKKAIVEKIKTYKDDADGKLDDFNKLRKEFNEIGFVPKKDIGSIKELFQKSVDEYLVGLTVLNQKQKTEISLESEFSSLVKSAPNEKELYHKEQAVRRHINKLEDDIALWQNNLEFFAKSKSADKLRVEVNKKIADASEQLNGLKRQLKMLRSI